jgi:hypothetical protein
VRSAAGRRKHPQRSPGDRNLRNAIRAPLPPPNGRKPGRNAVILAMPFQKKRGCQDCVAEVSVARTALRMSRPPTYMPNCAAVFLGASWVPDRTPFQHSLTAVLRQHHATNVAAAKRTAPGSRGSLDGGNIHDCVAQWRTAGRAELASETIRNSPPPKPPI